jgi:uncharacterized membrane protein YphA (DoxX/SURF4 family)
MKNKILFVISALFALMFINSGLNKFFDYMPMPEEMPQAMIDAFVAMSSIGWLLPLVAIAEILGGILVIIPKTRALGAIVLVPINIGIFLSHLNQSPEGLPIAIVLLVIHAWIIFENRAKYLPMIS